MSSDGKFLTMSRAAKLLGIDRGRIRELINRGELESYSDPLDQRKVLLSAADLARLHEPRRRPSQRSVPAASAAS